METGWKLESVFPPNATRPPLSFFHILVLQLGVYGLIAYAPRSPAARMCGFGALAFITTIVIMHTTGDIPQDYGLGCFCGAQLVYMFWLLMFANPLHEFCHEEDVQHPTEMSFLRRLWWAFCVVHSLRGIGWNRQVRAFCLTAKI